MVPATEIEDDMLGDVRDRTIDAAKSKATMKYEELRDSVRPQ